MSTVNVVTSDLKLQLSPTFSKHVPLVGGHQPIPHHEYPPVSPPPPFLAPPVEILSLIIEHGVEESKAVGDTRFPVLMSHTCTRLRDIVLSTPLLWTDINFVGGKTHPGAYDEIAARLERSSSVPIDVAATNIATKEDAEIFLRLVYPHVKRWRSFDLSVLDAHVAVSLMENLLDEAPILERMNLSGPGVRIFNPFGGRAPNLRHLSTRSMPLKWDGPLFDNLHTLSIHTPTWTQASLLGKWHSLKKLTIRSDPLMPMQFRFNSSHVVAPNLESLELNGITEEDIVRLLSHVEMPNLSRLLFTHIKDSPNQVNTQILPLPAVRVLRLHATEMCQDNLLNVLRKVPNLHTISFEDSSPIPSFISELTPRPKDQDTWVMPSVEDFRVLAFEKDNAHRVYDDSDIAKALLRMVRQREDAVKMCVRMCIFEGERDDLTRHAADWGVERRYKSVRNITSEGETTQ